MVEWDTLWYVLREFKIPEHLITLIRKLYERNTVYIKIEGQLSERFQTAK